MRPLIDPLAANVDVEPGVHLEIIGGVIVAAPAVPDGQQVTQDRIELIIRESRSIGQPESRVRETASAHPEKGGFFVHCQQDHV